MSLDYKLYEIAPHISKIIQENTDHETGEIAEEAVEQIIQLEEHAELKVHNCGQALRTYDTSIGDIDAEIKRLRADKQKLTNGKERLEQYVIRCSEILGIDKVTIAGRTTEIKDSRESVVVEDLDLLDPDFVVVVESRRADKRGIMRKWNSSKVPISGAEIVRRRIVKV